MSSTGPTVNFAVRGTQVLFAIVVFGISCSLIKGHKEGALPSTLGFVAFIGGVVFVASILGVAAYWIQILQGKLGMFIDVGIASLNVAGGILMAIKTLGVQCNLNHENITYNDVTCGGEKGTSCSWELGGRGYPK